MGEPLQTSCASVPAAEVNARVPFVQHWVTVINAEPETEVEGQLLSSLTMISVGCIVVVDANDTGILIGLAPV